jgi:hypothetical protein
MRRDRKKGHQPSQQYDTTFKDWIRKEARNVLPLFLPGASYEETLEVEIIRPTLRADKVFKGKYLGDESLFNVEFQTNTDNNLLSRLLVYNSVLYRDHGLPVISIIIYPFRTTMAESPLVISSGKKNIITFDFERLPLFLEEAEYYVREHATCMYPLLPTMQGVNRILMKQAMDELATLYQEDNVTLAQQLVWMELLLERTEEIDLSEKAEIQKELKMYDPLWEDHPKVKKIRAESEEKGRVKGRAEGRTEGRTEGELRASQNILVNVVKARFPALAELARQKASQINKPDVLTYLIEQVSTAPDETVARWLLSPPVD